jgi:hypothetical protein
MQGFLDAEVHGMYSYPNYICTGVPDVTGLLCSHSREEEAWLEPPPPPPASQSKSLCCSRRLAPAAYVNGGSSGMRPWRDADD